MDLTFKTDQNNIDAIDTILDREWLKGTFLLSDKELASDRNEHMEWIKKNRYRSSADYKISCTSPGMNLSCNPKPQFTRYADIRSKGKLLDRPDISIDEPSGSMKYGLGMGRYYSEAIDDNAQRIYMRFGTPKYSPIVGFIKNAFDIRRAVLNNRGVITSTLLEIVNITAFVFALAAAPILAVGMLVIGLLNLDARFYSLNPTMHLYWLAAENLVNSLAARRTLVPQILTEFAFKIDNKIGQERNVNKGMIDALHTLLPDVIDSKGRISIFGLALKAQTAFNQILHTTADQLANENNTNTGGEFLDYPITQDEVRPDSLFTNKAGDPSFFTMRVFKKAADILTPIPKKDKDKNSVSQDDILVTDSLYLGKDGNLIDLNLDKDNPKDTIDSRIQKNIDDNKGFYDKYKEYVLAEITEGAAFAVFTVEHTGSVGESFSNSLKINALESMFNGASEKIGGMFTSAKQAAGVVPFLDEVASLVGDTAAVIGSKATLGLANPLLALAYGLRVSLPKVWESSSASLPRASYKMRLISPYGNAFSQLFNIYLPLSMILAGGLPRATGTASHMSPFLCQVYDRGRLQMTLGMIDSISVTRGTSNLAFSKRAQANAVDVEFTIANLDEVLAIDITDGGILDNAGEVFMAPFRSDSAMNDYISVIAGLDVYNQFYILPKMRLKISEALLKANRLFDPDPAFAAGMTIGRFNLPKTIFGNSQQVIMQGRG